MSLKTASSNSVTVSTKNSLKVKKHSKFLVQSLSTHLNEVILSLAVKIDMLFPCKKWFSSLTLQPVGIVAPSCVRHHTNPCNRPEPIQNPTPGVPFAEWVTSLDGERSSGHQSQGVRYRIEDCTVLELSQQCDYRSLWGTERHPTVLITSSTHMGLCGWWCSFPGFRGTTMQQEHKRIMAETV
jgi:hypothetical protein